MKLDLNTKNLYTQEQLDQLVQDETKHAYYFVALERAKEMNTWFEAEMDNYATVYGDLFKGKEYIIKQSTIESTAEYNTKLERMRLFPLEGKFLSSQKRIYDENNVNRAYPDQTEDFWMWKETHFDDMGSSVTEFFRDRVLYVKEVLGFGAIVTDLMTDGEGDTIYKDGKPIPYNYILRPHEILNFDTHQGFLTLLVTRQVYFDVTGDEYRMYRVFTPDRILVYKQKADDQTKTLVKDIENPFGEVPATILRGETDSSSSFHIGKPRRFSLRGLYLAASELFYDLQQGSELFGHPIPVYPDSIAKAMAGVEDDDKYDASTIKEKVGACIVYPDDMPPPNKLFYQADMQGLQHLRDVVFKDLMSLIFNLAQVRDKSVVKSNVSGQAKFLDNVEEQGLLAQTAMDMEVLENEVMCRMAKVREEDESAFRVTYSKHYDLSSAGEIYDDIIEGFQYGSISLEVFKYLTGEYLRKRSAPQDVISKAMNEIESIGMPTSASDLESLSRVFVGADMTLHAQKFGIDSTTVEEVPLNNTDLEEEVLPEDDN